jgi:hypothetical protein
LATLVNERARVEKQLGLRSEEANRFGGGEAVEQGHLDVEERDVRLAFDGELHGLAAVDGGSDDL